MFQGLARTNHSLSKKKLQDFCGWSFAFILRKIESLVLVVMLSQHNCNWTTSGVAAFVFWGDAPTFIYPSPHNSIALPFSEILPSHSFRYYFKIRNIAGFTVEFVFDCRCTSHCCRFYLVCRVPGFLRVTKNRNVACWFENLPYIHISQLT